LRSSERGPFEEASEHLRRCCCCCSLSFQPGFIPALPSPPCTRYLLTGLAPTTTTGIVSIDVPPSFLLNPPRRSPPLLVPTVSSFTEENQHNLHPLPFTRSLQPTLPQRVLNEPSSYLYTPFSQIFALNSTDSIAGLPSLLFLHLAQSAILDHPSIFRPSSDHPTRETCTWKGGSTMAR
jgi:hypothetical protein